jgi:hypothetical protein
VALTTCIVCLACSHGDVHPSAPVAEGPARIVPVSSASTLTADAPRTISERVAAHVKEFGGAYIDAQGITIYLTDLSRAHDAREALAHELSAGGRETVSMRIRRGQYAFADLWRWKRALRSLLTLPGVAVVAVDERSNRLLVETTGNTSSLSAQIERLGVPRDAVSIEPTARVTQAGTIEVSVRPAVGGIRIAGFFSQASVAYTVICSYGPNVRNFADTVHHYMVVASHCVQHAPPVGGFIGANVYQPDTTAPRTNLIGTVVANPPYVAGGSCPAGALCRASDAALVRVATGVTTTLGAVARPTGRVFLPAIYGPTTISATQPTFALAGYTVSLVGDTVDKVGSATGWTAGLVTATCADVNISGYIRTCSGIVSAGAGRGDSGAPVLFKNALGRYYVAGMLYGFTDNGSDGQSGNQYFFSPWQGISDDLAGTTGLGVR